MTTMEFFFEIKTKKKIYNSSINFRVVVVVDWFVGSIGSVFGGSSSISSISIIFKRTDFSTKSLLVSKEKKRLEIKSNHK